MNELTLSGELAVLPLLWGPTKAYRKNGIAYVAWAADAGLETDHFEVEKNIGGTTWHFVNNYVPVNTTGAHYLQPDLSATAATTFYRIRQVNRDGGLNYSPVVSVEAITSKPRILVYPNPSHGLVHITGGDVCSIVLYNADGKLLYAKQTNGVLSHTLSITNLPSGNYRLLLQLTDGSISSQQLIKN